MRWIEGVFERKGGGEAGGEGKGYIYLLDLELVLS